MRSLVLAMILFAIGGFFSPEAIAETNGWSWDPFASSTTKSEIAFTSKESSSWFPQWKMPDVTGSVKKATRNVKNTTTNAWNSASRATKRAWRKTTEILDPFPNDSPTNTSSTKSKSSSSWFGGSKKNEKPATVQEFLRQERP